MKLVKVHIPFTDKVTGTQYNSGDEIVLTDERLAEVKAVNVNMVSVIGEAEEEQKKPRTRKKKED